MADVTATSKKIIANIEKVVIGKRQEIILALAAYLSEGHILLEDVPGVAKTMLARALANSVGASFKRVQCTPDLLPTDITGRPSSTRRPPSSNSGQGRSSRRSCWPTRSTGPPRAPRPPCSKRWASARSRSTARHST